MRSAHARPVRGRTVEQVTATHNPRTERDVFGMSVTLLENPFEIVAHVADGRNAGPEKRRPHWRTEVNVCVDQAGQYCTVAAIDSFDAGRQRRNVAHCLDHLLVYEHSGVRPRIIR